MAKVQRNLVIEEHEAEPRFLEVWVPVFTPVFARAVEAIEGVTSVYIHSTEGGLSVHFNPCYDRDEIVAEIKAISDV